MEITLNGEKVTVTPHYRSAAGATMSISYELLADLAGLAGRSPCISWRTPNGVGGLVMKGEKIALTEGLQIDVGVTGAA